jgi:HlyD family secretion protein
MSVAHEQQQNQRDLAPAPAPPPGDIVAEQGSPLLLRPRRRLAWIGLALGLAALAAGLGYYYWLRHAAAPTYRLGTVARGPVTASVLASGTVNPVITVQVGSQVSGRIRDLYADFNTEVQQGQLVARIDPDIFETHVDQAQADVSVARAAVSTQQAALERARADLESARSNLAAARAQTVKARAALADAKRDYDRKRELAEKGASAIALRDTAEAVYDQAKAQLATAEAQALSQEAAIRSAEAQVRTAEANVEAAQAQVQQKEAALRAAQVDLDHTYIRAPVDGTVVLRNVDVGQTVAASLQAPVLFTIARDLRAMQVDTSADEADVGAIKLGQHAVFTVDAYPGRTFEGDVLQIRKAPQVVQNVVTYDVVVSAPNPDLLLLPGLTASVRVTTAHRDDALLVPNAALRYGQLQAAKAAGPAGPRVFTIGPDGEPRSVSVKLGISDGNVTEIVEGPLQTGQQVIIGEVPASAARPASSLPGFGAAPRF